MDAKELLEIRKEKIYAIALTIIYIAIVFQFFENVPKQFGIEPDNLFHAALIALILPFAPVSGLFIDQMIPWGWAVAITLSTIVWQVVGTVLAKMRFAFSFSKKALVLSFIILLLFTLGFSYSRKTLAITDFIDLDRSKPDWRVAGYETYIFPFYQDSSYSDIIRDQFIIDSPKIILNFILAWILIYFLTNFALIRIEKNRQRS